MPIKSRADAIKYLNEHGHKAKERDWILGQTIQIFVGRQEDSYIGDYPIVISEGFLYIYPSGDKWAIDDANSIESTDPVYDSLQDAVIAAEDMANHYGEIQAKRREWKEKRRQNEQAIPKPLDPTELLRSSADMVSWKPYHHKAGKFLFRSEDEMRKVWVEQGGIEAEMPYIDFTTKMVVAIFVDQGTYRYSFGIRSIKQDGNTIKVFFARFESAWEMINPCTVYQLNRAQGNVEFIQINS